MITRSRYILNSFIKQDAAPGIVLMIAAALALVINNSPLSLFYQQFLDVPIAVQVGPLEIAKPLLLWVNDGLMAVFFFIVGLEIKREIMEGQLSSFDRAALPLVAAVGGMVAPAIIFVFINWGVPANIDGWAIPAATDIAFALGVLALLGPRVPVALKVLLLAVAIIDDLGAIIIIALFYTDQLSVASLLIGTVGLAILIAMNRFGVARTAPYILVGTFMWVAVLKSGVHATLAGVLVALTIPLRLPKNAPADAKSLLKSIEHSLHPWVAFLVLPMFAFVNAGVSLKGMQLADLIAPLPLGIALGLFFGKQIGVFGFSYIGAKTGLCRLPDGVNWAKVYGVACLTGIGFTMSLFIGTLAFDSSEQLNAVRLGVLMGSILSALLGFAILRWQLAVSGVAVSSNIRTGTAST